MKRKSRQIVGVQLPCGAKAQSLNIIIRIASPNIAEQVLTFYGWYNQISSMKASASGCEMHLHHLIYVCFRFTHAAKQNILRLWSCKFGLLITVYEFFNNWLWLNTIATQLSLNIIIRIAEQVLTFYGRYNQISSMKASGGCVRCTCITWSTFSLGLHTRPNKIFYVCEVPS